VWQIPDAVDKVVCAPDDAWWYHPKHVEQFPDKINCVTLHLVGYIFEYSVCTSFPLDMPAGVFSLCSVTVLVELEVKPGVQKWILYGIRFLGRILLLTHFMGGEWRGGGWISEELTRCCKVVTSSAARSSNPGRDSMVWMQGNTSHVRPSRTHSSPGQTWSMMSLNIKCWLYTRLATETRMPSEFIFPM